MKIILYSGIFLLLLSNNYLAAQTSVVKTYGPGETLNFRISYSFITAGNAYLSVTEDSLSGQRVVHLKAYARTSGVADVIYRVRDTYESYVNPKTKFPIRTIRNISEGSYKKYNKVRFDYSSRKDSSVVYSQARGKVVVPKTVYDILSGFYFFRNHYVHYPFKINETVFIQTYFTDELWALKIRYKGKEIVKTRSGKIKCLRFSPVTEVGRAFKSEDDMAVWFSDDENFIPVKIWFNLRVGSFKAELEKYEGLQHPFKSLIIKK